MARENSQAAARRFITRASQHTEGHVDGAVGERLEVSGAGVGGKEGGEPDTVALPCGVVDGLDGAGFGELFLCHEFFLEYGQRRCLKKIELGSSRTVSNNQGLYR